MNDFILTVFSPREFFFLVFSIMMDVTKPLYEGLMAYDQKKI